MIKGGVKKHRGWAKCSVGSCIQEALEFASRRETNGVALGAALDLRRGARAGSTSRPVTSPYQPTQRPCHRRASRPLRHASRLKATTRMTHSLGSLRPSLGTSYGYPTASKARGSPLRTIEHCVPKEGFRSIQSMCIFLKIKTVHLN